MTIFKKTKKNEVKTNIIKNKFLAIILRQNKSCALKWVSFNNDEFRNDGHTYFSVPEGMYLGKNKLLIGVYLEGVSTPLSHRHIKKKTVKRTITLDDGKTEEVEIDLIEGLKFDSEIIDILLNRGLAEKFTEVKPEKTIFILFILVIISIIVGIISIGVEFV